MSAHTLTPRSITTLKGASAGELDLLPYLGPCRVIHAIGVGPLIEWSHLAHAVEQMPPRVLVRTYARMPVDRWDPDLAAFAPADH